MKDSINHLKEAAPIMLTVGAGKSASIARVMAISGLHQTEIMDATAERLQELRSLALESVIFSLHIIEGRHTTKKHKPNTGTTIGSYKFKPKRK